MKIKRQNTGGGWNRITLQEDCIALMGKMPDKMLAKEFGLNPRTLQKKRQELGIQSWFEMKMQRRIEAMRKKR